MLADCYRCRLALLPRSDQVRQTWYVLTVRVEDIYTADIQTVGIQGGLQDGPLLFVDRRRSQTQSSQRKRSQFIEIEQHFNK
jgi:hypothetical protein